MPFESHTQLPTSTISALSVAPVPASERRSLYFTFPPMAAPRASHSTSLQPYAHHYPTACVCGGRPPSLNPSKALANPVHPGDRHWPAATHIKSRRRTALRSTTGNNLYDVITVVYLTRPHALATPVHIRRSRHQCSSLLLRMGEYGTSSRSPKQPGERHRLIPSQLSPSAGCPHWLQHNTAQRDHA